MADQARWRYRGRVADARSRRWRGRPGAQFTELLARALVPAGWRGSSQGCPSTTSESCDVVGPPMRLAQVSEFVDSHRGFSLKAAMSVHEAGEHEFEALRASGESAR